MGAANASGSISLSPLEVAYAARVDNSWYSARMAKVVEQMADVTPIAFTDELAAMADYVRSPEGRVAIERGREDIRQGRFIEGTNALANELKRRAALRQRG